MDLHNLTPAKGSTHAHKRKGRGTGSGKGGTSTRGHKGAQSRSGNHKKVGFEGGQMPLQRRLPKRVKTLVENGLAGKNDLVKILGRGEMKSKLDVKAHAFSASAKTAIESKGGTTTVIETKTAAPATK